MRVLILTPGLVEVDFEVRKELQTQSMGLKWINDHLSLGARMRVSLA